MTATPIFNGLDPEVGWKLKRIMARNKKVKLRRKASRARTLECSEVSGGSPFEQPREAWLRAQQAAYPSMHHPTDYPSSYPRVGCNAGEPAEIGAWGSRFRTARLNAEGKRRKKVRRSTVKARPAGRMRLDCTRVSGGSPFEQPREAWLRGQQAAYPSMHHPTDYPSSYPRVGMSGTSGGDIVQPLLGCGPSIGAQKIAEQLSGSSGGLWIKTRIYKDGHYLKASIYSVTAGMPKVVTLKVDLRPIYRAAVKMHRKLMTDPKISGDEQDDEALIGGWWKKLTRKVKKTVRKVAKNKLVRAATFVYRKAYKYTKKAHKLSWKYSKKFHKGAWKYSKKFHKKAFKFAKKIHVKSTRFAKSIARSKLVPLLATGLTLFPATTVLGVGMMAAWTVANKVVKASDAASSAGKAIYRDLKRGKLSGRSLMRAAAAGVSVASAVTGKKINLGKRLKKYTRGWSKRGMKALGRYGKSLRGRINLKGAKRLARAFKSKRGKIRRSAKKMYKVFRGKASAKGLVRGLLGRKTGRRAAKMLSFLASSKPLSRLPRLAMKQGRSAAAAKYLSLSKRGKNSFVARIKAKVTSTARRLKRRTLRMPRYKRAALAGAMSVVADAHNIARAQRIKRIVRKPTIRKVLRQEAGARRKAQRTIKAISRRAHFGTGSQRLKARKAAAVIALVKMNNARIAATVERNQGGVPSMLINSKGRIVRGRYSTSPRPAGLKADVLYLGPGKTQLTGSFTRVGYALPAGAYPLEGYWRPGAEGDV